jgi:hypothetical protein
MEELSINDALMKAVEYHRVDEVRELLAKGADPNYFRSWEETDPEGQPTTPLRTVVFCISDNLLGDDDLIEFAEITKLLLNYGGDAKPAMQLAELRYGKYQPNASTDPFMNVLKIIAGN